MATATAHATLANSSVTDSEILNVRRIVNKLAERERRGEPGLVALADLMDSDRIDEIAWHELAQALRDRGLAIRASRQLAGGML